MEEIVNSGYSHGGANLEKKTLKTWHPRHYSSKSDLDLNLRILRDRAYDLTVNSPLGSSAINAEVTGVIGAGLKVFPKIKFKELGLSAAAAREWSKRAQLEFEIWAKSLDSDFYRRNNFYELQRIVFASYLTDGDAFCIFRRRRGTSYSLRLQVIEAQRVSNPQEAGWSNLVEMELPNGNRIINGIEVSRSGRLEAIWVSNKIWNEPLSSTSLTKWQRVKIFGSSSGLRNVLHICYDMRPEMYRGVPFLAPVIESLRNISRYSDAELTSAIVKSFFSVFFVQPLSNFSFNEILPDENQLPVDVREYKLGSGTISALPRGVDVKAIDSGSSQSSFDSFVSHFVRQVSSALNLPEEILTKRFQSSYSAARASLLLAQDEFRMRRESFINDFCQPVYENFLIESIGSGRLDAPGFFDSEYQRYCWSVAQWRNEQTHSIDETKSVTAAQMRINLGLSTREAEAAILSGSDFYENVEELAVEEEMLRKIKHEEILEHGGE